MPPPGRHQVEQRRTFAAPRALVWALVADTNRLDRALGLAPATYEWVREGAKNLRLARATELGMPLEWIEPPYEWAEGHFLSGLRRFRRGPLSRAGVDTELCDVPGGTEVRVCAWVEASWAVGLVQKRRFASGLPRYLDALQALLAGAGPHPPDDPRGPAVSAARRQLSRAYVALASGPRARVDEAQLTRRLGQLSGAPPELVRRLGTLLRERPDDEVAQLRPFELARGWTGETGKGEADRREVLRTFLRATEAGLLELRWQVNCPECKVGARTAAGLSELSPTAHCAACEVDFELDFARHVEAVFSCHPAIRAVAPALYCASSPAFLPHVWGQFRPAAGQRLERTVRLPPGELTLRTLWVRRPAALAASPAPATLTVAIEADRLEVRAEGAAADGETRLIVENHTGDEAALLLERAGWSAEAVLGTSIASLPEFTRLFATDAPARGVELKVGAVALLFSDLTGSTALYERVGDARAFALVEEHFRVAEAAVAAHGGALIKTMGDAVMATFPALPQAVAAALALIRAHDARFAADGVGVKVGVYEGPCLAVRANDRLDYFGTTVNVCARLQAKAGASEVVLTEEGARDPAVAPLLAALRQRPFLAHLKGIAEEQRLVGVSG